MIKRTAGPLFGSCLRLQNAQAQQDSKLNATLQASSTASKFVNQQHALVTVCSWNTNGIMLWAWMLWSPYALGTRTELWFGHGCSGHRMLLEHERNYGLGMDALVTVCSWNTNGIMVWAWMLWSPYAAHQKNVRFAEKSPDGYY